MNSRTHAAGPARSAVGSQRPAARIELRAGELSAAETWLTTRAKNAPDPTDTDRVFITQSRRAATIRQRKIVAVLVSVVIAALTLSGIAIWQWRTAVWQFVPDSQAKKTQWRRRDRAVQMESVASNANDKAQANLRDAQVEQSLFFADQARQQRDRGPYSGSPACCRSSARRRLGRESTLRSGSGVTTRRGVADFAGAPLSKPRWRVA